MSTVIFIEGFDYYTSVNASVPTMTLNTRWTYTTDSGTSIIDLATGRFGSGTGQALYMNRTLSGFDRLAAPIVNSSTQYTIGFASQGVNLPASTTLWLSLFQNSVSATSNMDFYITSTGAIQVNHGATVLGTSSSGLTTQWQYLEFSIVASSTVGSVNIYADGTNILSLTGINTINVGTGVIDTVQFICSSTLTYYIDDMYVFSSSSPLGDSRVSLLTATADTTTEHWNVYPNTLTDHHSAIAGSTPDYTSYVYTNLSNIEDLYEFSNLSFSPSNIYAVQPVFAARKDDIGTKSIRMDVVSNSSTYNDASQSVTSSSTTFYRMEGTILNTNPITTQNWTVSDINGIQMGPETL